MRKLILLYSICIALFTACGDSVVSPEQIEKYPSIYPDYIGVTIPATIAPMNFSYTDTSYERIDVIVKGHQGKEVHINAKQSISRKKSGSNCSTPIKAIVYSLLSVSSKRVNGVLTNLSPCTSAPTRSITA